jgi:hypothetical protein
MDNKIEITEDNIGQYFDVLMLGKYVELVAQALSDGYGEVLMKSTIKNGKIKILTLTKTQTIDVDGLSKT